MAKEKKVSERPLKKKKVPERASAETEVDVGIETSADIVKSLLRENISLDGIAELTGLSKSFISRVKNRKKALRLQRLINLENGLQRPLPLLYLAAVDTASMSSKLRKQYELLRRIWQISAELTEDEHGITGE